MLIWNSEDIGDRVNWNEKLGFAQFLGLRADRNSMGTAFIGTNGFGQTCGSMNKRVEYGEAWKVWENVERYWQTSEGYEQTWRVWANVEGMGKRGGIWANDRINWKMGTVLL